MIKKFLHRILLLCLVLLAGGCIARDEIFGGEDMVLTISCSNTVLTKGESGDKGGVDSFNENRIESVDFLFYRGATPDPNTDAFLHLRREISGDAAQDGQASFNLVVKKDIMANLFSQSNTAFVYVLVNFDKSFVQDLTSTSLANLALQRLETDFAKTESGYIQPRLLMDGKAVLTYDENSNPSVEKEIEVSRFASKLTMAIHVADQVILKHEKPAGEIEAEPDETWTPVPHTMRLYLVDGAKTVKLSHDGTTIPDPAAEDDAPDYFSYSAAGNQRPFLTDNGTPYLTTETVGPNNDVYYNTWPMYSYPRQWSGEEMNYDQIDYPSYTPGLPPEPPYFKLEMDWRREAVNGYSYDRRKYYYKVYLPFNQLKRNNWYGFYLDVAILGAETDEGKLSLEPTCYLLDWQNKELAINKYAVISKARYLSLDKSNWDINNIETLTIPFLSSHNVMVVEESVKATRPYYGENASQQVNKYNKKLHAWVRKNSADNTYYLDFKGQADSPDGDLAYEPFKWLTNTTTSIVLKHPLQNNYEKEDFDYSPYTIEFDIIHTDLIDEPSSTTYKQYLRHITILQRPAVYIEAVPNSDTGIKKVGSVYGYDAAPNPSGWEDTAPWANQPWGYVYVNGGRFVRWDSQTSASTSKDPFFQLHTDNNKREYQWQTVWYTGGSRDLFNIHVTVLQAGSNFIIGDPRVDDVDNLDNPISYPNLYQFIVDGNYQQEDRRILEEIRPSTREYQDNVRTGFNKAKALYGDKYRSLEYYYPTEKSPRTENMLAPTYRIASKFGGTEYGGSVFGDLPKQFAEYRCAAYQEDGYPAGRWRLPTKAEIHFIAQLSANGAFERLFSNSTYWSANGAITVSNGSVSNSKSETALLRCVYDSWYWDQVDKEYLEGLEDDPRHNPRDEFVWGDRER